MDDLNNRDKFELADEDIEEAKGSIRKSKRGAVDLRTRVDDLEQELLLA